MNVNVKLTLSDSDRNLIARKLSGKNIKRLCSRADVVEMVNGFMAGCLNETELELELDVQAGRTAPQIGLPDLSQVPDRFKNKSDHWKVSYLRGRYGR
jgi:hypothetical protein